MTLKNPIQVTFRGLPHDDAIQAEIHNQIEHLAHGDRLHGCKVVIEPDEKHHQHGRRYQISVHVHLPGKELIVGKHPAPPEHEDALLAVRDAFHKVQRQVNDHFEKLQRHH